MNVTKLRNSTAVDSALGIAAINAALKKPSEKDSSDQSQTAKSFQQVQTNTEVTTHSVAAYLQGLATGSCGEIDALISDLSSLREKLVTEGGRLEQDIVEFATLNQSVVRLTEVIADSVTHVKAPSLSP
ncbi:MAG: hypothetical protein ACRDQZ_00210 [Mycobacteriales bacterium]